MRAGIWILTSLSLSPVLALPIGSDIAKRQRIPAIGSGPATATDGTPIIENQVVINGLTMRFKVSAPSSELVSTAGSKAGTLGINVLFHGDGGQSFFDFPNQGVNSGLMGVALLSPDSSLRWGGVGTQSSLERPQGPAHSAAVNQFLTTELPKIVNFDQTKIFLEGVSGGSLLLSGFMVPAFGASLGVPGVVMGCGGLPPQVQVQGDISGVRVHWQSTVNEQPELQQSIPQAIAAYEQIATNAGLSNAQINQLQTADASPNGGHCEFDQRDFVSGVQLLTNNYASILSGQGALNGVNVNNGVVGNENLFAASATGATRGGTQQQGTASTANRVANTGGRAKSATNRVNTGNTNTSGNRAKAANKVNTLVGSQINTVGPVGSTTGGRVRVNDRQ